MESVVFNRENWDVALEELIPPDVHRRLLQYAEDSVFNSWLSTSTVLVGAEQPLSEYVRIAIIACIQNQELPWKIPAQEFSIVEQESRLSKMLDSLALQSLETQFDWPTFNGLQLSNDCESQQQLLNCQGQLSPPVTLLDNTQQQPANQRDNSLQQPANQQDNAQQQPANQQDQDNALHIKMIHNVVNNLLGGVRGIQQLLLMRNTTGTVDMIPPPVSELLLAFEVPHLPNSPTPLKPPKPGAPPRPPPLTVGARALSKHCHRSGEGWWGSCNGKHEVKNNLARAKFYQIINNATWVNIHLVPKGKGEWQPMLEIRQSLGYGARWALVSVNDSSVDQFRGFLEPPMIDGHQKSWRH